MEFYLECIPCFQKQALFATRELPESKRAEVLKKVMELLLKTEWNLSPDEIANRVHALVRKEMGIEDPYLELKKRSNEVVLKLYPGLKKKVKKLPEEDRLFYCARLALTGNIIDFGPLTEFNIEKTLEEVMKKEPAINDFPGLKEKVLNAKTLLYFCDNAGEIVFDRIFVEEMLEARNKEFEKIVFVVKGGPILNDAMKEDAIEAGLDKLPNVEFYEIGNGEPGTGPSRRDKIVTEWINSFDLVISKGQGNFEGLSENKNLFFMLMAKCQIIAKKLGVKVGDTIIKYQK